MSGIDESKVAGACKLPAGAGRAATGTIDWVDSLEINNLILISRNESCFWPCCLLKSRFDEPFSTLESVTHWHSSARSHISQGQNNLRKHEL